MFGEFSDEDQRLVAFLEHAELRQASAIVIVVHETANLNADPEAGAGVLLNASDKRVLAVGAANKVILELAPKESGYIKSVPPGRIHITTVEHTGKWKERVVWATRLKVRDNRVRDLIWENETQGAGPPDYKLDVDGTLRRIDNSQ